VGVKGSTPSYVVTNMKPSAAMAVLALFSTFALAACSSAPDASEPKVGPLAVCCTKVSEALGRFSPFADVERTPEDNARIEGLSASAETCKGELAAASRDDEAAAIARVQKAAGSFDLALYVPECK
jgi:hypothetical protein